MCLIKFIRASTKRGIRVIILAWPGNPGSALARASAIHLPVNHLFPPLAFSPDIVPTIRRQARRFPLALAFAPFLLPFVTCDLIFEHTRA